MTTAKRGRTAGTVLVLTVCTLFSISPLVLVLIGSLRPTREIMTSPLGLPTSLDLSNYAKAWTDGALDSGFLNSILVTAASLILSLILYLPASFALGRWRFRGAFVIRFVFAIGLMVTLRIGIVPIAQAFTRLGLIDNIWALVPLYVAQAAPLMILILSTYYSQLPESIEESALLDGASHLQIFWLVMTPLVRPAIVVALVLGVGPIWNDFFFPLVLLRSDGNLTLPVAITRFFGQFTTDFGLLYAGIMIAVIPVLVLFAIAIRNIVAGLTAGIEK